jgi:general secretion pathway protein G
MPRMIIHSPHGIDRRSTALDPWLGSRGSGLEGRVLRIEPRAPSPEPRAARARGFTLIELIVVMAIIGILATIAVPMMRTAPIRARESALKENLYQMRSCIDQFHADRDRYPASIEELVEMGYLRAIPNDPITRQPDWGTEMPDVSGEETELEAEAGGGASGIIDVYSSSEDIALDGTKYSDW